MPAESPLKKRSIALHFSVWAGVVGPILFGLLFTIAGFLYPGYSPIRQVISTLGASGPYPWIQIANFLVSGLLLLIFSLGFFYKMREVIGRGTLIASTILLVLAGAGLIDAGIFSGSFPGDPQATALRAMLHNAGFLTIFLVLPIAFFLIGWSLRKIPAWRGYGWYSILAGIGSFGLLVVFIVFAARAAQVVGLWNRILVVEAFAWYVVMGYRLRK